MQVSEKNEFQELASPNTDHTEKGKVCYHNQQRIQQKAKFKAKSRCQVQVGIQDQEYPEHVILIWLLFEKSS